MLFLLLACSTSSAPESSTSSAPEPSTEPSTESRPERTVPDDGRESLTSAAVGLQANDLAAAETHARKAVVALAANDAPELADAVLMLGEIQTRAGKAVDLPDVTVDDAALRDAVIRRASLDAPEGVVPALAFLAERRPSEARHGALAGLAWQLDELDVARASALWLSQNGSPQARFEAGLLHARIDEQSGDLAAAEATYERTCASALKAYVPRCHREQGLFLAQIPEKTDAARTALRKAALSDDPDIRGRSLAALGVLEAHEGSEDAARIVLTDALASLPPSHPEAVFARDHLNALGTGQCGCDAPGPSLETVLMQRCEAALPGLVQEVVVDATGAVQMTLSREATPAEQAKLAELQEQVLAELP